MPHPALLINPNRKIAGAEAVEARLALARLLQSKDERGGARSDAPRMRHDLNKIAEFFGRDHPLKVKERMILKRMADIFVGIVR